MSLLRNSKSFQRELLSVVSENPCYGLYFPFINVNNLKLLAQPLGHIFGDVLVGNFDFDAEFGECEVRAVRVAFRELLMHHGTTSKVEIA